MASSQARNSFLTEKDVREATQTMSVGGVPGLRVTVQTSSSGRIIRSYTLRLTINGKRTQRGLGGVDEITLSQARMKAQQILDDTTDGKETRVCIPKTERIEPAKVLTVEELFTAWQSVQVSRGRWKGPEKTVRDDKARLYRLLSNELLQRPAHELTPQELADALLPNWELVHESCLRLCSRLSEAYQWGLRNLKIEGSNPAQYQNGVLGDLLPVYRGGPRHMGALPVSRVPDFFYALMNSTGSLPISGLFIAYSILTTARPGSILPTKWSEIDFDEEIHLIPRARMKIQGLEFNRLTPLSDQAKLILNLIPRFPGVDEIFVNFAARNKVPISQTSYANYIKRMCADGGDWHDPHITNKAGQPARMTVHGTGRASFKDWAKDAERYQHPVFAEDLIERCLDHSEGYKGAYTREQPIGDMRVIYQEWGRYCFSKISSK